MCKTPLQELDEKLEPRSVEIGNVTYGFANDEIDNAVRVSIAMSLKRIADALEIKGEDIFQETEGEVYCNCGNEINNVPRPGCKNPLIHF